MKLLTRLLRMRRPAGSVAEEAALSEIHMELLKEEYNTGELKLNIHRIPGTGIEVVVGENPTVMFTAHVDTVHRDIELQDIYVDDVGKCWAEFEGNPSVLGADDAGIETRLNKAYQGEARVQFDLWDNNKIRGGQLKTTLREKIRDLDIISGGYHLMTVGVSEQTIQRESGTDPFHYVVDGIIKWNKE